MPERDREVLASRKYRIYITEPLSPEHAQLLDGRGIALKQKDEWMAILVSWVKDHKRGDGPFVPSLRIV